MQSPEDQLAHALYGAIARLGALGDTVAILAPARMDLRRMLEFMDEAVDTSWLPGAAARASVRGTFEGVPFIAAQDYEATTLWVIDFSRLGTWRHAGAPDELTTWAESLHDQLVQAGDTRALATRITAQSYASGPVKCLRR